MQSHGPRALTCMMRSNSARVGVDEQAGVPDAGGHRQFGWNPPLGSGRTHRLVDFVRLGHVAGHVVGTGDVPGHRRGAAGTVSLGQRRADARASSDHQCERFGLAHVSPFAPPGQTVPGMR